MTAFLIAAAALPAMAGAALLLSGHRADAAAPVVAVGIAAVDLVYAVGAVLLPGPAVSAPLVADGPFALGVDGLSAVLLLMVTVVALLVLVFAAAERTAPAGRFHGLMLLFLAAVVVTVTATTLPALLLAWEIMGAASYVLIGFAWADPVKVDGGWVAFVVTRTADLGLYVAAGAAIGGGVGWRLDALSTASGGWLAAIAAGVLAAGLGKAAQLPFSFWLSRAMDGPSPVSALLHSAAMVAMGGYLLLRLQPVLNASGWAAPTAAWVGAATAVLLGVVALAQRDLKQVLAASTASQLGFVVLAAGVGTIAGGTFQLVAHAATKALLFLAAGAWLSALGTRQLSALRGAARRWPVVGVTFTVGAVSLAGLPPLSLWLAKDVVLAAALEAQPALYVAGLVGAALSAAYASRILVILLARPRGDEDRGFDDAEPGSRRVPPLAAVPLIVLAVTAIGLAAAALPPVRRPLLALLGGHAAVPGPLELVASAVIAAAVLGLTIWRGGAAFPIGAHWFGLESAARTAVAQPVLRLAMLCARFDDQLDRAVAGVSTTTLRLAGVTRVLDERGVDGGVERAAAGVGAAGSRVRALQTGRIDRYFIAATTAGLAAVLLLIVVR